MADQAFDQDLKIQALKNDVMMYVGVFQKALECPVTEKIASLERALENKYKTREHELDIIESTLAHEKRRLEQEKKEWNEVRSKRVIELALIQNKPLIQLKFGEKVFHTTTSTLFNIPESTLTVTVEEMLKSNPTSKQIVIDRDPTHFSKILNYFRDKNLVYWLKDARITVTDLEMIEAEAKYYNIGCLVKIIKWEIAFRQECITTDDLVNVLRLRMIHNSQHVIIALETSTENNFVQENFSKCEMKRIIFNHRQIFSYCDLRMVIFKECTFNVPLFLTDSNVEGMRFLKCKSLLPPKEIIIVDEGFENVVPASW